MGFFNNLFGKKEKTEVNKGTEEAVVTENNAQETDIETEKAEDVKTESIQNTENTTTAQTSDTQEELNRNSYTLMIEQVFTIKTKGCIVVGILRNGTMQTGDEIYVLGRGRQVLTSKVLGMENPEVGEMKTAGPGTPVGILLDGIEASQLHMGDIISNVAPNTEDVDRPAENPRLKGLLRFAAGNPSEEIMNLVYEEIAMNACFLSAVMLSEEPETNEDGTAKFKEGSVMQLPQLTAPNGAKFQPAFTDWQELEKWEDMKKPKTLLLTFDDYAALVLKNPEIQGVVINPFSENMMMERELLEHLRMKKDMLLKESSRQQTGEE